MLGILNLVAILLGPIIAVLIGQVLQDRAEKRKERMAILRALMVSRTGPTIEGMNALNTIDIIFADDKRVRDCWREYFDKLSTDNPSQAELKKMEDAQYRLIEAVLKSLGYKNKVSWETIQKPYKPKGLVYWEQMQQKAVEGQVKMMESVGVFSEKN